MIASGRDGRSNSATTIQEGLRNGAKAWQAIVDQVTPLGSPSACYAPYTTDLRPQSPAGESGANQECCCSSTLGSANSRRKRGFGCAGRSKAATKAFHWSAFNEKWRWSASATSASAQALRMMNSERLSPRSCAPCRISSSCWAEVLRFRRRDRGALKVESIASSSVQTLYDSEDDSGNPTPLGSFR